MMREFTLFGLDECARLLSTERVTLPDEDAARATARERLLRFSRVEVWDGAICICRTSRETHGAAVQRRPA